MVGLDVSQSHPLCLVERKMVSIGSQTFLLLCIFGTELSTGIENFIIKQDFMYIQICEMYYPAIVIE